MVIFHSLPVCFDKVLPLLGYAADHNTRRALSLGCIVARDVNSFGGKELDYPII